MMLSDEQLWRGDCGRRPIRAGLRPDPAGAWPWPPHHAAGGQHHQARRQDPHRPRAGKLRKGRQLEGCVNEYFKDVAEPEPLYFG